MPEEKKKEVGDLLTIISRARSHADWTAFMFQSGPYARFGQMRVKSVERTLKDTFNCVARIRDIAQRTGNQEILAILDEEHEVLPVHD